jgi:transcriptional regulator with XRE-family HTH domain
MTHPGMGYSAAEVLMLVAEEAVELRVLRRQGKSIREIARMQDVSRNTVWRYLRREGRPRYEREARPSKLDPYKHYTSTEGPDTQSRTSAASLTKESAVFDTVGGWRSLSRLRLWTRQSPLAALTSGTPSGLNVTRRSPALWGVHHPSECWPRLTAISARVYEKHIPAWRSD